MHFFEEVDCIPLVQQKRMEYKRPEDLQFNLKAISLQYTGSTLSPLAQYYIAPYIFWGSNCCVILPSASIDILGKTMQQLLCHFENVDYLTSEGNSYEVRLQNLKPASKETFLLLMSQKKINPFIIEMFQFNGCYDSSGDYKIVRLINNPIQSMDQITVDPAHLKEFDEIWNFIKLQYLKDQYTTLSPNMIFSDTLVNSILIQYFLVQCQEVYISVDNQSSRLLELTLIF